jgi:ribosome-binding factor A
VADSKRIQRVEREVREIVSTFLISGLRERPEGMVTVTRVWVAKDLRLARVYFSVFGGDQKPKEVEDILQDQAPEAQRAVANQLTMKFTPVIEFYYDEAFEQSQKMNELFKKIEAEKVKKPTEDNG